MGLSNRWGSEERTILKDCEVSQKAGANVHLYTYKDSVIDLRAKELGIKRIYHQGKFVTKFYKWHKLRRLKGLITELKINVVHCYDIKVLWPLCLYLRQFPEVPLLFSLGNDLKTYYRDFWYRPLVERVDQILLPMPEMVENVWGHIGVPPRKIESVGLGLAVPVKNPIEERPPFRFTDKRWYLGTNLNGIETNTHFLDTIFHAFRVLIERGLEGKSYTFTLCNERNWSECVLTDELRRQVKDWGLEEHVAFVEESDVGLHQPYIDLWLGLVRREDLEDYAVQALLGGKPVLIPRTASSMELFRGFGVIGETYLKGDSREIREKVETILGNIGTYEKNLHKSHEFLLSSYGAKSYQNIMISTYKKVLKRRKRLLKAKRSRNKLLSRRNSP